MLRVNAMIVGTLTQFGTEKKDIGILAGICKWMSWKCGGMIVDRQKGKAKVGITARILNVSTGEILFSGGGQGESSRSGLILGGLGGAGTTIAGGGISITSSDFRETILGEATYAAVAQLVQGLIDAEAKIPITKIDISGFVADVNGGNVVVNVGSLQDVQVGDVLQVLSVVKVIVDPMTKEPIRHETAPVGEIRIVQVEDKSSAGMIVQLSPGAAIKVGDLVRNK